MGGHLRHRDLILALLCSGPLFAVYAALTCRDLGWVDSVELALAGAALGIPHATGYPLYILLARLAVASGLDAAFAVNLLAAACGAAACGVVFTLGRRMGLGIIGSLAGALVLAGSRELLAQSTVAEVYTLHLLLVGLILSAAMRAGGVARKTPEGDDQAGSRAGASSLLLLAYLLGLGFAHHLTLVLTIPSLALLLLGGSRERGLAAHGRSRPTILAPPRVLAVAAALFLTPITLYAVLALRSAADPVLDQGDPATLPRLLAHVAGRQFSYRLLTSESTYVWAEIARFFHLLAEQWTVALLPLAALGVVALARRPHRRRLLLALLLLMAAVIAHAVAYRIPDKEPYYLPAYLVVALLIAAGVDFTLGLLARRGRAERRLAGLALLAAVLVPLIVHLPAADRHADRSLRDLTREVLRRTTPGSLIVSDDTSLYFASLYLKASEGVFSDREPVASYLLPLAWYAESVGRLDAAVPAEAAAQEARRRGLAGRALGDRLAADARALVAGVARRGLGRRDVFLYFHRFDEERKSFEGLRLEDRGLVYQVVSGDPVAPSTADRVTAPDAAAAQAPIPIPDATFERLDAYTADRRLTVEERSVARRFAVAANRAGIARVRRGDLEDAEAEFKTALALSPDYAQAWLNLGLLYADFLRLPEEAVRAWGTYLELAGSEPEAAPVRARLTRLTRLQTESETAAPLDSVGPEP